MAESIGSVRVLGPADVPAALEVVGRDPVVNVFADYRTRITQLDTRWLGGEMWGYVEDDALVSLCHVGANMVPVGATSAACAAFADRASRLGQKSSTIVGSARRGRRCSGTGCAAAGGRRATNVGTSRTWSPGSVPGSRPTRR